MNIEIKEEEIKAIKSSSNESNISEDLTHVPVMIGTLKSKQGIKGFIVAEIGHPVFETKDRYIIYLESEKELTEQVYNQKLKGFEKKVGKFLIALPYYKKTLEPAINFLTE